MAKAIKLSDTDWTTTSESIHTHTHSDMLCHPYLLLQTQSARVVVCSHWSFDGGSQTAMCKTSNTFGKELGHVPSV